MYLLHALRKLTRKLPILVYDVLSIPLAWYAAYWLRFNMHPYPHILTSSHSSFALMLLLLVQMGCYVYFKTYRGLWRFASLDDVLRIMKASLTAVMLVIPIFYLTSVLQHLPRAIFPLYVIILIMLLCGGRLARRLHSDKKGKLDNAETKNVLIIGAGLAGEGLARDLRRSGYYKPVGFVDDNMSKRGQEVQGVPVLGAINDINQLARDYSIDLIFIAIPSARSVDMRRIVTFCEETTIPFRTLPSINNLPSGHIEVNALRPVNLEDLLGRDEVSLQWDKIGLGVRGKKILVTGGGGSIGSELCRQIALLEPLSLTILESSEFNLYQIDQELRKKFPKLAVELALISVTDGVAINHLFSQIKPDIVFHAAAYKHVPMLQGQVCVAVFNNVIGTELIAKASASSGAQKFVLISTDKAVNPTNIMGATKRVAEIFCQNLDSRVKTQFITVRFGNVLGSAGSVIPLFQKQLQSGGPLTVTHPDMQRYFMTIPEAAQLILQAMVNGQGGEIFVLDMGEPIKISYLAEQMIRLAGKEPGKDIQIEYIGLRPGEKLYEELFHESEQLIPTENDKLFKAKFRELDWQDLIQTMRMINNACFERQSEELIILLKSIVPELTLHELADVKSSVLV